MRILLSALYPYIFVLLYLLLPFDDYVRALPNILLVVLLISFPFVVEKHQLRKLKSPPILLLVFFVFYLFLNSFISGRIETDFDVIGKVALALLLVILYIPIGDSEKIKGAIILSALAAILFSVYNFVIIAHETGSFALGDSPQVVESLLIDRIYLALLCVFSILISFQGIKRTYHPLNSYYLANMAINLVFIILIASKIAVMALLILLIVRQFYGRKRIRKYALALCCTAAVAGVFYILKNKDDSEIRKFIPPILHPFVSSSMTYELRAVTWNCVDDIATEKTSGAFGFGFEQTEAALVECYGATIDDHEKRELFLSKRYNAHSQYLDFYLSEGWVSLVFMGVFLFGSFVVVRKNRYATSMLVLLIFYCAVENVFHRQMGAYYAGAIIITLMLAATAGSGVAIENERTIENNQ